MDTMFARTAKPFFAEPFNSPLDQPPPDFDTAANPILAKHWYGVEPSRQIAPEVGALFRRQRQIEHVYRLGLRAVEELLFEVAEGEDLDRALEAYQRLTPGMLKAVGGDRFPPLPIHEVVS